MNKPVTIEGVQVKPNQLIFADSEGIVVIPPEIETELLGKVLKAARTEKQILIDIAMGVPVQQLTERHGNF
jgi:regulator of RNase E activity RraA